MTKTLQSPASRTKLLNPSRLVAVSLISTLLSLGNAGAVLIEFTSGEGYASGNLDGQLSQWEVINGNATSYVVNPPGLTLSTGVTGSPLAVYQTSTDFAVGLTFTTYLDFSFVQSATPPAAAAGMTGLTFLTAGTSGSTGMNAGFGRTAVTDQYRITANPSNVNTTFAGSLIGINSGLGDNTSDELRLEFNLTKSATLNTWTAQVILYNLTTSTTVATLSPLSFTTTNAIYTDSSLFGAISNSTAVAANISQLNGLAYSSPVPEPGAITLIGLGALTVFRRRRQS